MKTSHTALKICRQGYTRVSYVTCQARSLEQRYRGSISATNGTSFTTPQY